MKLSRLRGRKNNEYLLKNGNVWKGQTMIIRWLKGHPKNLPAAPARSLFYLGTFASSRLHAGAVQRNRMRRRCREALRITLAGHPEMSTVQALLTPKIQSLSCDFDLIVRDVTAFLALLERSA